jgi:multidrug efflux pump subunit AcrA (membrane-fusion protein)
VAQEAKNPGAVTVDALVVQTLSGNPEIRAARAEVEAAQGRLRQAGLRPNPVLDVSAQQNVTGADQNLNVGVMLPLDLNGRKAGRVSVAARELDIKEAQVTERAANPDQVVAIGEALFTVTDLSEVWAVGDFYEQDFPHVRVGSDAALTTLAYPGLPRRGRVTYVDPRVDPHTRRAKVRVEVSNPEGRLRLGMYVTVTFSTPSQERVIVVPRAAVQTIGGCHVVFVAVPDEAGKILQRCVELGPLAGESYPVRQGLQSGDVVVTEGSFFLRAESVRNALGS